MQHASDAAIIQLTGPHLELGLAGVQHLLYFQGHAHARPHGAELREPAILDALRVVW